jgi:hypothetical protein
MAINQPNVTSEETEAVDKPPRWLVATVIILGLAIIGMLVLMVVKIMAGDGGDEGGEVAGALQAPSIQGAVPSATYLKEASISRPEGSRLDSVEVYGHEMVMHFRLADGGDLVIVLNRVTGETSRIIVP